VYEYRIVPFQTSALSITYIYISITYNP